MIQKHLARMGTAFMIAAVAACQGDGATAPTTVATAPSVKLEVVSPDVPASVLTRTAPLAADSTVSKVIGPLGGTLQVPGGLTVVVPHFAVDHYVTVTATALAGRAVAYEFGPHGTTFNVPLVMMQDLHGTAGAALTALGSTEIGYFSDRSHLNDDTNRASISEFLPATLSASVRNRVLLYTVKHFSGYVIVTGRNPNP
ncbi:MAG TPA: hypothetical protein VFJ74_08465 [Gemmatimonadaceae bacterium]|nr:hypothetical protein [Gemmatimonadaceae bacterium]